MKTTLALLIAGLIFLATPMLATAEGRHGDERQNHYKGWVKNDQHDQKPHYDRSDYRHNYRYDQNRNHRVKKHHRQELREMRQELRQAKRQIQHNHRRPHYVRSHHVTPAVLLGIPHLVFQFGW